MFLFLSFTLSIIVTLQSLSSITSIFHIEITANYNNILGIPGIVLKTVFGCIGIFYAAKIIYDMIEMFKHRYTHEVLLKDIENLDKIQHNHSLVIIKDDADSGKQRFLVYYDERWDCKLFPNYKTQDRKNEQFLIDQVSADLNIDKDEITCTYLSSRIQEKYSVSHCENRTYNHRLYEIKIRDINCINHENDFVKNERHYYWMTLSDMEKDENILNKNLEVVDFVKETCINS